MSLRSNAVKLDAILNSHHGRVYDYIFGWQAEGPPFDFPDEWLFRQVKPAIAYTTRDSFGWNSALNRQWLWNNRWRFGSMA